MSIEKVLERNFTKITDKYREFALKKDKTIRANFEIPLKFLGDYVRGIFDGDGGILARRNSIETYFASASEGFWMI